MKLVQLIYYSSIVGDLSKNSVESILTVAREKNADSGISGLLLFSNSYFLQVIEGPRPAVNKLFANIQGDKRHSNVALLMYRDIQARDFSDWSMGWANEVKVKLAVYFRYGSRAELLPDELTGDSALALMRDMKEHTSSLRT